MAIAKPTMSLLLLLYALLATTVAEYFVIRPITTGINITTGARPFRKDVTSLVGPERDLFLLALQQMQRADQEEKLSWFQVAGIHGCPPISWDGVPPFPGRSRNGYPGYAVHNCGLFLPWHRAYLLLLENILSKNAISIAQKYSNELKPEYIEAARSLRWPYWKWDGPSKTLPQIMINRMVSVRAPEGQIVIKNPLESYSFHPVMTTEQSMGYSIFRNRSNQQMATETVRCPDKNGQSDYIPIARSMSNMWRAMRTSLYNNYIEKGQSFSAWAFIAAIDRSVETIHGNVHSAVGCSGGFMTILAAAAFDPSFFLHHANVDRQWEIWSAIHYNEYMVERMCYNEDFARKSGIENDLSSLYPFHSDAAGSFHTPRSVRYTKDLGYAYEEVPDWQFSTQDALAQHVLRYVTAANLEPGQTKLATSPARTTSKRWWVDSVLEVDPGQIATLYYFFGNPPAKTEQWTTKSNLILSQAFLPRNDTNTRTARLSLTPSLTEAIEKGSLKDFQDQSVKTFLKQQFRWRVMTSDLFGLLSTITPKILVQIVDQSVVKVEKNGLTEYGPINAHPDLVWDGSTS